MPFSENDRRLMARALELAAKGQGLVEPNPMVGCVIAKEGEIIAEGWHQRFGGPHAEREALAAAEGNLQDATLYVTLEPCCHHGKTAPCTDALLDTSLARIVVAQEDPFLQVSGKGIEQLRQGGVNVEVGLLQKEAEQLNTPYLKLIGKNKPWVVAKWAMTLDGRIATQTGSSQWISGPQSRAVVHQLRGRVDAIIIGRQTAVIDDPLLTARPAGPRVATRVVLDTHAQLPPASQLVRTVDEAPLLVVHGESAPLSNLDRLRGAGVEVMQLACEERTEQVRQLLGQLGKRRMTNVLVEGGADVLGSFLDAGEVDETWVFIAPKLVGGKKSCSPVGGKGVQAMGDAVQFTSCEVCQLGEDVFVRGMVAR